MDGGKTAAKAERRGFGHQSSRSPSKAPTTGIQHWSAPDGNGIDLHALIILMLSRHEYQRAGPYARYLVDTRNIGLPSTPSHARKGQPHRRNINLCPLLQRIEGPRTNATQSNCLPPSYL